MTHMEIVAKIESARPGAKWTFTGTTYDGLTWLDDVQSKPTPEELGL